MANGCLQCLSDSTSNSYYAYDNTLYNKCVQVSAPNCFIAERETKKC